MSFLFLDYFKHYADHAGVAHYNPTFVAQKVRQGDDISIAHASGASVRASAWEDGWVVGLKDNGTSIFLKDADFSTMFQSFSKDATRVFPEQGVVTPVLKGEDIEVFGWVGSAFTWDGDDAPVRMKAPVAGYVVMLPEYNMQPHFMSDIDFRSTFKTDVVPLDPEVVSGLFRYSDRSNFVPTRFVVLDKDMTFYFDERTSCEAKKGDVLFENPEAYDGIEFREGHKFFEQFDILRSYGCDLDSQHTTEAKPKLG